MITPGAKWVCTAEMTASPIFEGEVNLSEEESAVLSICGLGFFEVFINGKKVSDDLFVPAWSDYEPRPARRLLYPLRDTVNHRVYYMDYDIYPYLSQGANKMEVWVGNGWYNQRARNVEGDLWYGLPKLAFSIALENGAGEKKVIESGEWLTYRLSPIIFNNVYLGETWDFALSSSALGGESFPVSIAAPPLGKLQLQTSPADGIIREIKPKLIMTEGRRKVYDAGECISGFVTGICHGHVRINYADELNDDLTLNYSSSGGKEQIQRHEYLNGQGESFRPKFSLCAFRYFEVWGDVSELSVAVVHAKVAVTSSFTSDNETLNWLYETYLRTQLTNMHYGVPSDCPHRERLGYTGDGQITINTAMMMLDAKDFFRKWMEDVRDSQDIFTGHVQHTAPFYGGGGGPGGWGCAIVVLPYFFYEHTGDRETLQRFWPHMRLWIEYMASRCEDGLVTHEEEGGWCLGEWCTPEAVALPEPFVNTYFYIKSMQQMLEIGEIIGDASIASMLESQIDDSTKSLIKNYYDADEQSFLSGIQGADAFGLDLGLFRDRLQERLNDKYATQPEYDTGIFGTEIVTRLLFETGHWQTAFDLLTSNEAVSFQSMKERGATTLYETWSGNASHNHPMFGAVTACLFEYILGIRRMAPGYKKVCIAPVPIDGLNDAKGHITTKSGVIAIAYTKSDEGIVFQVEISEDIEAVFSYDGVEKTLSSGMNKIVTPL